MKMDKCFLGPESKIKSRVAQIPTPVEFEVAALELEYPYLGHRDYAHGSSMLEGMLRAVKLINPDIVEKGFIIKQFKVINQFDCLSRAEAMRTSDAAKHPLLGKAKARLDLIFDKERYTSLLFALDQPISWRLKEYSAGDYVTQVKWLNKDLSVGNVTGIVDFIDLIRGINECNRQLTVKSFPDADWSSRVRWAYLMNIPLFTDKQCSKITKVFFKETETVEVKNHRFEIKKGWLEGLDSLSEFEICFFIELPNAKE